MANDMNPKTGGEPGTMQGQIKTPMCKANVQPKGGGDGRVYDFSSTMNLNAAGGSKGALKTDSSIKGPGEKGMYPNKGSK